MAHVTDIGRLQHMLDHVRQEIQDAVKGCRDVNDCLEVYEGLKRDMKALDAQWTAALAKADHLSEMVTR